MKKTLRNKLLLAAVVLFSSCLFYACRKEFRHDSKESNAAILAAKDFYSTLINDEKELLSLPFTQLKKTANLRRFARIGKMASNIVWEEAQNYSRSGINYSIVPVDNSGHVLKNESFHSIRYLLFSRKDGDKMQMNIIEMYSKKDQSLDPQIVDILQTSVENFLFKETNPIHNLNASVIFYDNYYYNRASYLVENGKWTEANIIVENTTKKFIINDVKANTVGGGAKNSPRQLLNSVSPMSGCQSCSVYYLVGIWTDLSTGMIIGTELLDSWDDCTEVNHTPQGSTPGTTTVVSSTTNNNTNPKHVVNNVNDPCLAGVLASAATAIESAVMTAQNNENIYMPVNLNFDDVSTLAADHMGETSTMYLDGNGVMNIDMLLNGNVLPSTSKEFSTRTMIHEAMHAALLLNGYSWSNVLQHEAMGNMYQGLIASTLRSVFPSLSNWEASALAWAGLKTSSAWGKLTQNQRDTIDAIISDFANGNSGTYC